MAAISPQLSTTTKTPFLRHGLLPPPPPKIFHHHQRRDTQIFLLRSILQAPHKLPAALALRRLRHPVTHGSGGAPLECQKGGGFGGGNAWTLYESLAVDRPDLAERVNILEVHSRGKALAKDVDFDKIASWTSGFTGAKLQNLMNEAAILAAQRDLKEISEDEISDALKGIIAVSEEFKRRVAYHEAGHALVCLLMPKYDRIFKISIIPRGELQGLTCYITRKEMFQSEIYSYLGKKMAAALGGSAAEDVVFGKGNVVEEVLNVAKEVIFGKENVTTGVPSDFEQVSRTAWKMVEMRGFSKKVGQLSLGGGGGISFLGKQMALPKDYSKATADVIDSEVRELVERAYDRAKKLITRHIDILHELAELLIEREIVDGEDFEILFLGGRVELFICDS